MEFEPAVLSSFNDTYPTVNSICCKDNCSWD